ncbi:MAG: AAA family ATPase [Gemmatimonadetes bacterium]|nr:AAA family ATPase [Gemmatimonadota bacterium]
MLKSLALRGFRGFQSYELAEPTTVNLLVGKNNCGKTSLLEAVELLVSNGHLSVFSEVARRRGEVVVHQSRYRANVSHLFFGHTCEPGACFKLSSGDGRELSATIHSLDELGEDAYQWEARRNERRRELDEDEETEPAFGLRIAPGAEKEAVALPISEDGTILHFSRRPTWRNSLSLSPVRFLGLESFVSERMGDAWDKVLAEGLEDEIAEDMRLLVPEIDSVHFLTGRLGPGGILVGLQGGGGRMPIGSYGDGLRRLLALRLALVFATDGYLLIDEIDAGMHWTVIEDLWRLLVEVADRCNVQIYATTHSYDCVRGLGMLVRSRPGLAEKVSLQKVHADLDHAVPIRGEQIGTAVKQEIEVR